MINIIILYKNLTILLNSMLFQKIISFLFIKINAFWHFHHLFGPHLK